MKKKTLDTLLIIVIFFIWPISILFFEGLYVEQSVLIPIGFLAIVVWLWIRHWWATVKIPNPKAIHSRGIINICGTRPFVTVPEQCDEDGNKILPEWFIIANEGIFRPVKFFTTVGGGENGYTVVPKKNVIEVGHCLNLNTADIDDFVDADAKREIPKDVIKAIMQECSRLGIPYSDEHPISLGWKASDDHKEGDLKLHTMQKHLIQQLTRELRDVEDSKERWRNEAVMWKSHFESNRQNQNQQYQPPPQPAQQ